MSAPEPPATPPSWLQLALQSHLKGLEAGLKEALRLADPMDPALPQVERWLEWIQQSKEQDSPLDVYPSPSPVHSESPEPYSSLPSQATVSPSANVQPQPAPLDELEAVQSNLGHPWQDACLSLWRAMGDDESQEQALRSFHVRSVESVTDLTSEKSPETNPRTELRRTLLDWAASRFGNTDANATAAGSAGGGDHDSVQHAWTFIQRRLFREANASSWRQELIKKLSSTGWSPHLGYTMPLPFSENDLEWEGSAAVLLPGMVHETGGNVPGFRLSAEWEIQEIQAAMEGAEPSLAFLGRWMSFWIWMLNHEAELFHGLKGLNQFMIQPIQEKNRRSYQKEILRRFVRARDHQLDASGLKLWIDFHEALASLLYLPPFSQETLLGKLNRAARFHLKNLCETYTAKTGEPAFIRHLLGAYADINEYTDQQTNLPIPQGGEPGEVAVCLRLYAEINQTPIPGRVLYGAH